MKNIYWIGGGLLCMLGVIWVWRRRRAAARRQLVGLPTNDLSAPVYATTFMGAPCVQVQEARAAKRLQALSPDVVRRWVPGIPQTSLFPSEGANRQRYARVMRRAMRSESLARLSSTIRGACVRDLVDTLRKDGHVPHLYRFCHSLVVRVVLRFAHGQRVPHELVALADANERGHILTMIGFLAPSWLSHLLFPSIRLQRDIRRALLKATREGEHSDSLLHAMLEENESLAEPLTDEELLANVVGIGVGGNDSTASGLTSCIVALMKDTEAAAAIRAEFQAAEHAGALDEPNAQFETILPRARALVDATLAAHPPFRSLVPRYALQAVEFEGATVPKGAWFTVDLVKIGRAGGVDAAQPFGTGTHACIAKQLATRLLVCAVGSVAAHFEVTSPSLPIDQIELTNVGRVTQPKQPLEVKFVENCH